MSRLKEYKVPFLGLKEGVHQFEFLLEDKFFEEFESLDWENGRAEVQMNLDKKENMMVADFEMKAELDMTCDRCGDPLKVHTNSENRLVIKFGEQTEMTDDDILMLGPAEYELDLAPFLYEYLVLSIPSRRVHEDEDLCNQEAIDRLEQFEDNDDDSTDPRWDALKNIK